MRIFVCEDEVALRKSYLKIIDAYLERNNLSAQLFESGDPTSLFAQIKDTKEAMLFFLDIDLKASITGIQVAQQIRQHHPLAKIVFITTHEEQTPLVFKYKIEALDFIDKNPQTIKENIESCLTIFFQREELQLKEATLQIKTKAQVKQIPFREILFIDSLHPTSVLTLHTENGRHEFYGSLNGIEQTSDLLVRTHKSCVVNKTKIRFIDKKMLEIELINGQRCLVSRRRLKNIAKQIQ
jgi:two-component system response regulator AgrA